MQKAGLQRRLDAGTSRRCLRETDWRSIFEAGPMRYQQGQSQDPTASLRDDDDDDFGWNDDDWNDDKHERAADYHRAVAQKATSLDSASAHYQAADLHSAAARQYPDLNASFSARAASKSFSALRELLVVDFSLKVVTEKQCEAAHALAEHLDCKDDQRGLSMLDELLEYTTMLVTF